MAGIAYKDHSGASLHVTYKKQNVQKTLDLELSYLKGRVGGSGEFQKKELKDKTVYWMPIDDRAKSHSYAAYVYSLSKDAGAETIYSAECEDKTIYVPTFQTKG
ncbi:hypothetical protein [Priestia koreensis]|uniref:hypothetical protein n=1 Tax=Priestia koreensis TaxID=284581 RepID=UPI00203D00E5|nr:hypothetical protein [Priestia koreensis]MCM3004617.1 hypothetical protein [Priestia koreensis]